MNRRDFIKLFGLAGMTYGRNAFAMASRATDPNQAQARKPNIIVFMADDVSAREFGCYGNTEHNTPVLDSLAENGLMFKTCWCTPLCSPTRAEIMTGRYGFRTKWFHNQMKPRGQQKGSNLTDENMIFSQCLKQAGYATAICGKWQLTGTYEEYGFDEHCMWEKYEGFDGPIETQELKGRLGTVIGRAARYWHPSIIKNGLPLPTGPNDYGPDIFTDFAIDFAKRHMDKPFMVYYPMCLPHMSWDFEADRSGYLPVPGENGKIKGTLKSNLEYTDQLMGRIINGLEKAGLRDNTIIMFTADNGTCAYGKNNAYQERGPRVPMIINCPGRVKARGAVDNLIDFSDILPTLCDLGGAIIPEDYIIDGVSFANLLEGKDYTERQWIFSYLGKKRFLRDKRWLLDGNGKFYDTKGNRDEQDYIDVTEDTSPQVLQAKNRFAEILKKLPAPTQAQIEMYAAPSLEI